MISTHKGSAAVFHDGDRRYMLVEVGGELHEEDVNNFELILDTVRSGSYYLHKDGSTFSFLSESTHAE